MLGYTLRGMYTVCAGPVAGITDSALTRVFPVTAADCEADDCESRLARVQEEASAYMLKLMRTQKLGWVISEWIWVPSAWKESFQ